jgi:uncharacterized membrane protein
MWIIWAVACATLNAATSALTKRAAQDGGAIAVTFWTFAFSIPLTLLALAWTGMPAIGPGFWAALAIGVSLNVAAITLRNLGLKLSPLSVSIPLLSFTPVFLLVTEAAILGDRPGPQGIAGVLLVVIGAYSLNLGEARGGILQPIRVVLRDRGCQFMLVVAALWGITSVIDKVCVTRSSPVFYLVAFHIGFVVGYLPLLAWRRSTGASLRPVLWRRYLLIAAIHFGSILTQMIAIQLTLVSYVIAIKRSGMLISVLIGVLFFGERGLRERLAGAALMSAGVALILTA